MDDQNIIHKNRPINVKCVLTGVYRSEQTWCGRHSDAWEWSFEDPTHAVLNSKQHGQNLICPECSDAIKLALELGTYSEEKSKTIVDRYVDICEELDKETANPGRSYMSRQWVYDTHNKRQELWNNMTPFQREQATIRRKGKP